MDVNEDSVAPWKADGVGGCAEEESVEDGGGGGGGGVAELGMNDVTTATGCAISRRSARILWEIPRTLLVARLEEGQRFAVARASAKRDMVLNQGDLMFVFVGVLSYQPSKPAQLNSIDGASTFQQSKQ
jgi:hypothetical protein